MAGGADDGADGGADVGGGADDGVEGVEPAGAVTGTDGNGVTLGDRAGSGARIQITSTVATRIPITAPAATTISRRRLGSIGGLRRPAPALGFIASTPFR